MLRKYLIISVIGAALVLTGCASVMQWADNLPVQSVSAGVSHGDPDHGSELFHFGANNAPPCSSCHITTTGGSGFAIGPNLMGIAERAGVRVPGLSAEDYLRDSILDPEGFLAPGFRNMMYPTYQNHYSEQDVADLVAYLMTL